MEVVYWQCPLCGWRRPEKYGVKQRNGGGKREVRFDKVNVEEVKVWQLWELHGAGRGAKEAVMEELDYKRLRNLPESVKNQIKNQCEKIIAELEKE